MPHAEEARPWVLFDLDGTLFDYDRAEADAVTATLLVVGVEAGEDCLARYRRINRGHWAAFERGETSAAQLGVQRWADLLDELVPHRRSTIDLEALATGYLQHLAAGSHLLPGAEEVIARLRASHRIGFVTNGSADVQRPRLASSALAEAGEVLVVSEEVGAAKPAAAIFDAAFAAMGQPPRSQVTMVGDSLSADIAGARAYGLTAVWVAPRTVPDPDDPALRPDHRIGTLAELPAVLGLTS
jgi:2-haloacid dehalogenase